MHRGKRDRTNAKNPPFTVHYFLTNVALRIWVVLKSRSNSIPLLSVKGLITWPLAFSFCVLQKSWIFWFEIDPGVCSFWDLEDYYLFASPIVHIGRPPWDGPCLPLPATILPILSYSYQLIITSSSFLPWNSFSLTFNRRWCTFFFELVYFFV